MKKFVLILSAACAAAALTGCGETNTANSDKLDVCVSFYAMQDFAKAIGGDKININTLCPSNVEPHDYELEMSQMAALTECDVFIYNGMGMEAWADTAISTLSGTDVQIVEASSAVPNISEDYDPHVWLDPDNAYAEMDAIADAFCAADPDNKEYYISNLAECKIKTDHLKADFKSAVNEFSSKTIITSHQAYFTMCNAFGLTQLAINGSDNSGEPTPGHMMELENYIKTNNIKYIFTEPLGENPVVNTIAAETGCQLLTLDPFEGSTEEKDYFTVMYDNLDAISQALK